MRNIIGMLIVILSLSPLTGSRVAVTYDDFFVVAHEDDDLLFMNPDIQNSIDMKNKVRIVYVTAGDLSVSDWNRREQGILNAYSFMAGMKTCTGPGDSACTNMLNQWGWSNPRSPADASGKEYIIYWTSPPRGGTIELIFLRLPDGGLDGLYTVSGKTLTALNCTDKCTVINGKKVQMTSTPTYTKTDLVNILRDFMTRQSFAPAWINTLDSKAAPCTDYRGCKGCQAGMACVDSVSRRDGCPAQAECLRTVYCASDANGAITDHPDHIYSARFAQDAYGELTVKPRRESYYGHNTALKPENVCGDALKKKSDTFFVYYAPFGQIDGSKPSDYWSWIKRRSLYLE
jgi:hypothetical protein